jgi:sensor domain CHASE-containing protein
MSRRYVHSEKEYIPVMIGFLLLVIVVLLIWMFLMVSKLHDLKEEKQNSVDEVQVTEQDDTEGKKVAVRGSRCERTEDGVPTWTIK